MPVEVADAEPTAVDFVDATVFLGMNSTDADVRRTCTAFFAERLTGRLAISLEQVGRCDDVIWGYPRREQDAYYPFMDNLHTDLRFDRLGYDEHDVAVAQQGDHDLAIADRLLLAMTTNRHATLYTLNPALLARRHAPVRRPESPGADRTPFPGELETLYQDSLALLVDLDQL